ncbi:MAG: GtrA family protein [Thermodesulfobacteriota bacterium]|nr:MAG: GtrA family protein [Thermodesulfobacteriota bacterium]
MLEKLFVYDIDNVAIQLFRYTFVGGIAFLGDFGTLFFMTEYVNLNYLISAAIAFVIGLTINYLLSVSWVFSKRKLNSRFVEFIIYSFIGLIGLCLNESFMWILTEKIHFYYLVSKIWTTGIIYLWNFSVRRFVLFT